MKRTSFLALILVILCLAFSGVVLAAATDGTAESEERVDKKPAGTRDLVFEDEDESKITEKEEITPPPAIAGGEKISIKVSLELTRNDKTEIVPPTSTFKTGDRVRLIYTPGMDGHIYWLARMTSGKYTVLFPTAKTGLDNAVKKGAEYTMPVKGRFRFDENTGTEILMCVVSPNRLADLDAAVAEADKAGGQVDLNSRKIDALQDMNLEKRKTRDLVFEEDEDDSSNTKTQTAKPGEPFVAIYELVHE